MRINKRLIRHSKITIENKYLKDLTLIQNTIIKIGSYLNEAVYKLGQVLIQAFHTEHDFLKDDCYSKNIIIEAGFEKCND